MKTPCAVSGFFTYNRQDRNSATDHYLSILYASCWCIQGRCLISLLQVCQKSHALILEVSVACLVCPLSSEDSSRPQRSAVLHKRIKWLDKKEGIILSVGLSGHSIKGQLNVLVLVMQAWILHKVDVILGGDSHHHLFFLSPEFQTMVLSWVLRTKRSQVSSHLPTSGVKWTQPPLPDPFLLNY